MKTINLRKKMWGKGRFIFMSSLPLVTWNKEAVIGEMHVSTSLNRYLSVNCITFEKDPVSNS